MVQVSALDFLSKQSPAVVATLLHDAMRQQDLASLGLLAQLNYFNPTPCTPHALDDLTRYSMSASPVYCAVASICTGASYVSMDEDPIMEEGYVGPAHQRLVLKQEVSAEFSTFIHGLFEGYLAAVRAEMSATEQVREFELRNELRATSGCFLAAAAVMDDGALARKVLAAAEVADWASDNRLAWISKAVLQPKHANVERMIHPVSVAFEASSEVVFDAFVEAGWNPRLAMEVDSPIPSSSKALARPFFNPKYATGLNLFELVQSEELTMTPGMLFKVLPMLRHPDGKYMDDPVVKDLAKWAHSLLEEDELQIDLVRVLTEDGVYEIDPQASFLVAARRGVIEVVDHLEDKVDWALFESEKRPVDEVFCSSYWEEHSEEMKEFAMHVMQMCVRNGHGEMLRDPAFVAIHNDYVARMPIIECAKRGMTDGFVLCLEQGADPEFENEESKSALSIANDRGEENYVDIARSTRARRAASLAIEGLEDDPKVVRAVKP